MDSTRAFGLETGMMGWFAYSEMKRKQSNAADEKECQDADGQRILGCK